MTEDRADVDVLAAIIWETSRADEGTISATGAQIISRHILASDWLAARDVKARAVFAPLEDRICDAYLAAKHGSYDGRPADKHLLRLLEEFRAAMG